jgi:hypothetical protein
MTVVKLDPASLGLTFTCVGLDFTRRCQPQYVAHAETLVGAYVGYPPVPLPADAKADLSIDLLVASSSSSSSSTAAAACGTRVFALTGAQLAPGFRPSDSFPANRTQLLAHAYANASRAVKDLIVLLTPQ